MISVIVPVYDGERYIGECLDSILAQTYRDIEVVVVDDGSTDATAEIVHRYATADPRVRYLFKENGGLSSSRNFGLRNARGELVSFVDSDDMIDSRFCEILLSQLGDADIVKCAYSRKAARCDAPASIRFAPSVFIEKTLYQTRFHNSAWAAIYRKALFDKLQFVNGLYYEDLEIFYKLIEASGKDVVWIDSPFYYYRENSRSIINTFTLKRLDVLAVTEQIEKHYASTSLAGAARNRRFSANYNMSILFGLNGHREISRQCWSIVKSYRKEVLFDSAGRLKNRIGAAVSYLGLDFSLFIAKIIKLTQ